MSEQLDKLRKLTSRTWLNSGNSSAIVNESKDDEPGFLESVLIFTGTPASVSALSDRKSVV